MTDLTAGELRIEKKKQKTVFTCQVSNLHRNVLYFWVEVIPTARDFRVISART